MGVLPKIDFRLTKEQKQEEERELQQGKTFLIDFQKGEMIRRDGKLIKTDDKRAVQMWITKVLLTQKNKHEIYMMRGFKRYGMEYREKLEGFRMAPILISEFKRELVDIMLTNKEIAEVRDIAVELIGGTLKTSFSVKLRDGNEIRWEDEAL